ncbi:MAG: Holliday junction resolvase RecU [Bacilli bacterium]
MIINKTTFLRCGNRGMELEALINDANNFYNANKIAFIEKRPTPINVVTVKNGIITKAYFEKESTLDFNGIYKQKYIEFEAKSCNSKTSFNLNNLRPHQIDHINKLVEQKAISFLIIEFSTLNKYFILKSEVLQSYLKNNTKKSIPLKFFVKNCNEIELGIKPYLNYLKVIEKEFYFE